MKTYKELKEVTFINMYKSLKKCRKKNLKQKVRIESLREQLKTSKHSCETERMKLAACGVIALSNTRDSAKEQRKIHPDYHSSSLDDVIRAVDAEMDLREKLASASNELTELSVATVNAVQCMSGGKAKADLRDAYDKANNFIKQLEGKGNE